ncbi:hypothetical protein, partial [Streptomyces sp. Wh19]|uniref:hypothetical protein n=1 Tax=Streptomyces sp. Wh19 TaxID=3076629 RepID=UPI002958B777
MPDEPVTGELVPAGSAPAGSVPGAAVAGRPAPGTARPVPYAMLGGVETRSVSPVFVGREGEFASLVDALGRAC